MSQRKTDHIKMAAISVPATVNSDERFFYEPMLSAHPKESITTDFLGKKMKHPLWVSSMTGGTKEANIINHRLAEAAAEFGLGMGLGSCRSLLQSDEHWDDFNLRSIIGDSLPFYANLGIAQIERMLHEGTLDQIHDLVKKLDADGLFIHVNPTQEWLQPEGDRLAMSPVETIRRFLDSVKGAYKVLVKEVGQGMGPNSLKQLLSMEIDGLEFGAFGGTNFANIEIMRNQDGPPKYLYPLATFGHNAVQMLDMVNEIILEQAVKCKQLIVSGGVRNFLDGYYLVKKSSINAVYGMAGTMLQHAMESEKDLHDFLEAEIKGYQFANTFLNIRS